MATTEWGRVSFTDPANGTTTTVIIYADKKADGTDGVEFTLKVEGNSSISPGDLLGFFLDFEADITKPEAGPYYEGPIEEFTWDNDAVDKVGEGNSMNGAPSYVGGLSSDPDGDYDIGLRLSEPGASSGNLITTTISINGITLDDLDGQNFGVRLQNTLNTAGSLKLVGQFEKPVDPGFVYGGYSRGSWLNGAFSDVLTGTKEGSFETLIFGPGGNPDLVFVSQEKRVSQSYPDPTLKEALGLNGGGNNQLAAQASAAYLNALYLELDGDPLTRYQVDRSAIKTLTADALVDDDPGEGVDPVDLGGYYWYIDTNGTAGFQADDTPIIGTATMTATDLTNLFNFNNNLSGLTTPLPNPMLTNPMVGV